MGTYIGLVIEEKLSIGMVILRIVTTEDSTEEIVSFMQSENYGITTVDATGSRGNVKMILSLVTLSMFPVSQRTFNQQIPTHSILLRMCGT